MVQQKNMKKRLVSESEVDKKKIDVPKKKKTENGVVQNGQPNKQAKNDVAKKLKNEKKNDNTVTVQNPKKKEIGEVDLKQNKKPDNEEKKLILLKKREAYREKRKVNRADKQYGVAPDLSVDAIKKKIQQIESRSNITKSAKRKLAALRKKLRMEEGTEEQTVVAKKQTDKSKNEKSLGVVKKKKDQNNEQKKKLQGKQESKLINKENKKKQNNALLLKQKKAKEDEEEDEEEEEDDDKEIDISEDDDESDLEAAEEEEEDDEDEDGDEDEDEDDNDDEDEDDDDDEDEELEEEEEEKKDTKVKVYSNQSPKEKGKPKNAAEDKKKRYVLFVGNLPYTITNEELKKHFSTKVSQIVDIRIPKKDANTARGFAYVELANNTDYEKALSLHHSFVNGRRINVQYSGDNKKVGVAKNFKLQALQKAGKLAGGRNQKHAGNRGKQNMRATKT